MAMVQAYSTDVRTMSDAELRELSQEMEDAFQCSGQDDTYWTDDEAFARYCEMRGELHRRFMLANPDWKPPSPSDLTRLALEVFHRDLAFSRRVNEEFSRGFSRIGDTVTVRMPVKFVSQQEQSNG